MVYVTRKNYNNMDFFILRELKKQKCAYSAALSDYGFLVITMVEGLQG